MGASMVTTASTDALHNINKVADESKKQNVPHPQQHQNINQSPPPECPMHAENKSKTSSNSSECPITGEKGDINLLNMVIETFLEEYQL